MFNMSSLAPLLSFQAPFICLIVCSYIFITMGRNGLTRMQFFLVKALAIACVLSMLAEILSGLLNYGIVEGNSQMFTWFTIIGYTIMLLNAMLWCEFCLSKCNTPSRALSILIRLMYFVTFILITGRIAFQNTKLYIYYENSTISYGPLDDLQSYACIILYILIFVTLIIKYCDKHEFASKEEYGKLIFATSVILLASIVYVTTWLPYILWIGHMMAILHVYTTFQRSVIYTDELTQLSNRRRMLNTIDSKIKLDSDWSYIILDVNFFKQINDTYGHSEGDHALQIIASILRDVAGNSSSSAFRYGGDEFVIIHDSNDRETVKNICDEIDRRFDEYNREEKLPYLLSVSCGYAIYRENDTITVPDMMELADQRMYEVKKQKKKGMPGRSR